MPSAVLKQIISQQEREILETLEKRWAQRTTDLEWKDILDGIQDLKKSNSDLQAHAEIQKILKQSDDIQSFYQMMVGLIPMEDRSSQGAQTIPAPPPLTRLDPNIQLPDYLDSANQEILRRLPFARGSTLKGEDVLSVIQELKNTVGPVDQILHNFLKKSKTMDIFHASICVHIMNITKPPSIYNRLETSIYASPQVTLREDLFFPDYLSLSDKIRLQVLFFRKDTGLKWNDVISAISDLRKITGTNDSYFSLCLLESGTIEAFYQRIVAHVRSKSM